MENPNDDGPDFNHLTQKDPIDLEHVDVKIHEDIEEDGHEQIT